MTPWEVEAKLLLGAADARALARRRTLDDCPLQVLPTQRLRTIYLDTPTFRLARHGVALRVRATGTAWEATAKWGGEIKAAVHRRAELTVPLSRRPRFPFSLPRGPLATRLRALIAGAPLAPILVTEIERRRRLVLRDADDARALAELDIDRVTLRRPRQRPIAPPYWEVEAELRQGTEGDLRRLARVLRRQYHATPSRESKFTRGLRLFHPHVTSAREAPAIIAADSAHRAARTAVARQLARLQRRDATMRAGDDAAALHDMRVATRRLRAALRAFKPGFPGRLRSRLKRELAWLTDVLGDVRDLDVQLASLEARTNRRTQATLAPLRAHLLAQRARRGAALATALDSARYARLIANLDACTLAAEPDAPGVSAAAAGGHALHRELDRLRDAGRRAAEDPTAEHLHAVRIMAKRSRYVLELLREITGRSGTRLTKLLTELQDELGRHHDAVVAMTTTQELLRARGSRSRLPELRRFAAAQRRAAERDGRRARAAWKLAQPRLAENIHAVLARLAPAAGDEHP